MQVLFCACAHSCAIDENSKRLSIFNVIEQINSTGFPVAAPPLFFIASILKERGDKDEINLQLVIDLDGEEIAHLPLSASFLGKPRNRTIAEIGGLLVPSPGQLNFCVKNGSKVLSRWPIFVTDISSPSLKAVPASSASGVAKKRKTTSKKLKAAKKTTAKKTTSAKKKTTAKRTSRKR